MAAHQKLRPPPDGVVPATLGPDGIKRASEDEARINASFAAWLSGPVGVECMAYLKSITIESVAGPLIGNDELRHREGQRYLVGLMATRKALHEKAQRRAHTSTFTDHASTLADVAARLNGLRSGDPPSTEGQGVPTPVPVATDGPPAQASPPNGSVPSEAPGYRPRWLPEKYKTAEDFRQGYDHLTQAYTRKTEDLKKEIEQGFFKERPETPDKYELPKFEGPIEVDVDALSKNGLTSWWREKAHAKGLSQAEFQEGMQKYIENYAATLPNEAEERKKLGENANARLEAVSLWAGQNLSEAEWIEAEKTARTANGVALLERFMKMTKPVTPSPSNGSEAPTRDRPDDEHVIQGLMNSPAYWNQAKRDPAVVARVERFYKLKYNSQ